jgi:AraC-like DNA-binding protein
MQWDDRLIKERRGCDAPTSAALWAPHSELATCVRAYVTRSTVAAKLGELDRLNYFPAAPTCAITWFIQGDYAHMDMVGNRIHHDLPRPVMFTGPHTQPTVSANPGEVDVFILLILPDALHALTGLDIAALVDRYCAPVDVLDADWLLMVNAVLHAVDNTHRIQIIEDFLLPRWRALGQERASTGSAFQHWAHVVASRAEMHAQGRSERQIDRRIKDWTGLPLRQLRCMGRAESTLLQARAALAADQLKWADIAATMGFSDQAHLSREFRRVTGSNPRELKDLLSQESHWMYQIWA